MLTQHVVARAQQRGVKESDLPLVCEFGTEVSGGYLMTKKDIEAAERWFRQELDRLSKLQDVFVAADGDDLITTFRATKVQRRDRLKKRKRRSYSTTFKRRVGAESSA